jgi:glycosyltransferase involved in cell wall biosynthesis
MRVLLITNISYPHGMADTRRVCSIIQGLSDNNISVELIVSGVNSSINTDHSYLKVRSAGNLNLAVKKKTFLRLLYNRLKWFVICIKALIRNRKDHVYFYQPNIDNFIVAIVAKLFFIRKTTVEYCDIISKENNNKDIMYYLQIISWRLFPYLVNNINVISTRLKRYFSVYYPHVKTVLMPAFFTRRKHKIMPLNRNENDVINIVFTGSFVKSEGLDMLFKVFSQIINGYKNKMLLHVAGYSLLKVKDEPTQLARKYNVEQFVRLHGYLDSDEVFELLDQGHILVLSKLNTKVNRFGFSTKLLDYLSSNRLVVCSDISDFRLYLEDKRDLFYFDPKSETSLYIVLKHCLENMNAMTKVSSSGFQRAQEVFDPANYIKEWKNSIAK